MERILYYSNFLFVKFLNNKILGSRFLRPILCRLLYFNLWMRIYSKFFVVWIAVKFFLNKLELSQKLDKIYS